MPSGAGPIDFGASRSVSSLAVGAIHGCAVLDNGDVHCWGFGEGGRLGYGDTDNIGDNETPGSAGPIDVIDNAPIAVDDFFTVDEDAVPTVLPVLVNENDPDQGSNRIFSTSDPAHGTVAITGGGTGLTYSPDPDYCNTPNGTRDSFTYTINGGTSATVRVTVTCIDDLPLPVNDTFTVTEDDPAAALPVLANDTDSDGGPITITGASDPSRGTVAVDAGGGGLTYAPDANYCNTPSGSPDKFTYTLNDGLRAHGLDDRELRRRAAAGHTGEAGQDRPRDDADDAAQGRDQDEEEERASVTFEFSANEAVSKFECRLDDASYAACTSPLALTVKRGAHSLDVRAFDIAGNVDGPAASYDFTVKKKKKKRR